MNACPVVITRTLLHRRITAGGQAGVMHRRAARVLTPRSDFAGFRFPPEVIMVAVRWYLRYGLSYRDVEELLGERGIAVDHVTVYRWVQRFTPLLIDAAPVNHVASEDTLTSPTASTVVRFVKSAYFSLSIRSGCRS